MARVTRLTPAGRGAVAVIAFEGDPAVIDAPPTLFRAASDKSIAELPVGRVAFGQWGEEPVEDVVVCRTGGERVEICCHGGEAAAARLMADLGRRGCDIAQGNERSSESNERLLDWELLDALSRATTLRTADLLLQQQSGLLRETIENLAGCDPERTRRQVGELLSWGEFGVHLAQPWRVVICGRPNVGKSSLINALVGYARSIVFDQPGTTRDVVTVETVLDGWLVAFSDTAGLRDDADELETAGIERARRQIADADLRVALLDTSAPPHADDERLLMTWPDAIVVAHKCDLPCVWGNALPATSLAVSSLTGAGVDRLAGEIVRRLVPRDPAPMTPLPITPRQVKTLREIRQRIDEGKNTDEIRQRTAALISGSSERRPPV